MRGHCETVVEINLRSIERYKNKRGKDGAEDRCERGGQGEFALRVAFSLARKGVPM